MTSTILIADDDPVQRRLYEATLSRANLRTIVAENGTQALNAMTANSDIDAVILDLVMPGIDGIGVLEQMQADALSMPVIVQTAQGSMDTAIRAMRAGAFDFLVKPASPDRLLGSISDALKVKERAKPAIDSSARSKKKNVSEREIIGNGPEIDRIRKLIAKAADSNIPVLIEGQSGTGKELVAHAIQSKGSRANKPFVIVNCGAMPENLVESILFGHEKGAFTGATEKRSGKFVEAQGGTLFLDEVGDLPLEAQVKLLRAIQEGQIEPVGASKSVSVNVRLISATHRNLIELVRNGKFREDLFYRLNVFPIIVPPLRNRLEDIPVLAEHFLSTIGTAEGKDLTLDRSALDLFMRYDWPGNIRQLQNAIFRAVVLAADEGVLYPQDFAYIASQIVAPPGHLEAHRAPTQSVTPPPLETPEAAVQNQVLQETPQPIEREEKLAWNDRGDIRSLADIEERVIRLAIDKYNGRMSEVARRLEIGRSTLYRKLKDYEIAH
ncbi:MAG: sigma-54 dependent transcriptional regulator [Pseudomonadota bacterium]